MLENHLGRQDKTFLRAAPDSATLSLSSPFLHGTKVCQLMHDAELLRDSCLQCQSCRLCLLARTWLSLQWLSVCLQGVCGRKVQVQVVGNKQTFPLPVIAFLCHCLPNYFSPVGSTLSGWRKLSTEFSVTENVPHFGASSTYFPQILHLLLCILHYGVYIQ